MNREITIADALEIISRIDNLREMRHQILKLRSKMKGIKDYPLVAFQK